MNKAVLLFLLIFSYFSTSLLAEFKIKENKGANIEVSYNNKPVAKLMTENDKSSDAAALRTYKVYLHIMNPLNSKETLTKGAGHKFPHHRGIYIGWSKTKIEGKSYDTWHMKNGTRQEYDKIVSQTVREDSASLIVSINWVNGEDLLLREEREFIFNKPNSQGAYIIDKKSKITAVKGDTELNGDREHAGCQFRANEHVVSNKSANYLFAEDHISEKDVKVRTDIAWSAMNFKVGGNDFHVQHMTHPSLTKNLKYSAYRDYGRFGSFMTRTIKKGESFTFPFRFYVSPSAFPKTMVADSIERYKSFAN